MPITVLVMHGAGDAADAAGQRCAADDGRSERVELIHHAHTGLRRLRAGGGDNAGEACKHAGNGIDFDQMRLDIDARRALPERWRRSRR